MKLDPLDARKIVWDFSRFEARKCPFCEGSRSFHAFVRPDSCNVLRCITCDGYYVSPAPSKEYLDEFYQNYHEKHFNIQSDEKPQNDKRGLNLSDITDEKLLFVFEEIHKFQGKSFNILDFGCGKGDFLYYAKQMGASVFGVEVDSSAVSACHLLGLSDVVLGGYEAIDEIGQQFDLITLNDVIEHPIDPDYLIAKLVNKLKDGGKLLIWTPNGDAIEGDPEKVTLRVDLEHMQYLTAGAVAQICSRHQLIVWHYQQIGHPGTNNFISNQSKISAKLAARRIIASVPLLPKLVAVARSVKGLFTVNRRRRGLRGNYHAFVVLKKSGES